MMITNRLICIYLLLPTFLLVRNSHAQTAPVSEAILQQAIRPTASIPANIHKAYEQYNSMKPQLDSLDRMFQVAYPALAERMEKRSARLNAMINYNAEDAVLTLAQPNQKMTSFS